MKILIMGLPGAGKTHLANLLRVKLGAVHFNADKVRATLNSSLGFSLADRVEHAYRMGCLCDFVIESDLIAIADFVCPTPVTRAAFNADFVIWLDTITESRFADTNALFVSPLGSEVDLTITSLNYNVDDIADIIIEAIRRSKWRAK